MSRELAERMARLRVVVLGAAKLARPSNDSCTSSHSSCCSSSLGLGGGGGGGGAGEGECVLQRGGEAGVGAGAGECGCSSSACVVGMGGRIRQRGPSCLRKAGGQQQVHGEL